ncbi:MAG: tRNA (adenosine(37)-N6)-threonylcarbamoyltransferase complex dimerization subunit type 1 TsaB [Xylophilus ampelinus]
MHFLAFDTSTDRLSVALRHGDRTQLHEGPGGPRASAALIPAIEALLRAAGIGLRDLDAIVFGRGPGSFTGLRTACAVAQGLGFGAGVPLLPVDTLLAVAEDARARHGCTRVLATLDARMDEVYAAGYAWRGADGGPDPDAGWRAVAWAAPGADGPGGDAGPVLARPEALALPAGWTLAGNAFAVYPERMAAVAAAQVEARPAAEALLRLAPALLAAGGAVDAAAALPLYVRNKVAETTAEREAKRAAAAAAPADTPPAAAPSAR